MNVKKNKLINEKQNKKTSKLINDNLSTLPPELPQA